MDPNGWSASVMDDYFVKTMAQASQSAQEAALSTEKLAEDMRAIMRELKILRYKREPYVIQEEP